MALANPQALLQRSASLETAYHRQQSSRELLVTLLVTLGCARRFGQAIAPSYGTLFVFHVVFGQFIALATVSASRGIGLYMKAFLKSRAAAETITKGMELEHA